MFNSLLGGAFGMQHGYFNQWQSNYQPMMQQQLQNMYSLAIKGCNHIKTECPICERNREQAIKDSAEKKEAYKNRCIEWMKKVSRKPKTPNHS
jgi:hypothetical protein